MARKSRWLEVFRTRDWVLKVVVKVGSPTRLLSRVDCEEMKHSDLEVLVALDRPQEGSAGRELDSWSRCPLDMLQE